MARIGLAFGFAVIGYIFYDFFSDLSVTKKQLQMVLCMRDCERPETSYFHHDTFTAG